MSKFETDLNHRERAKLVADMTAICKAMDGVKEALETANDEELIIQYIIATLGWHSVRTTLDRVMKDAVEVMKGQDGLDKFRGFNV